MVEPTTRGPSVDLSVMYKKDTLADLVVGYCAIGVWMGVAYSVGIVVQVISQCRSLGDKYEPSLKPLKNNSHLEGLVQYVIDPGLIVKDIRYDLTNHVGTNFYLFKPEQRSHESSINQTTELT